jgi:hypothetical protein
VGMLVLDHDGKHFLLLFFPTFIVCLCVKVCLLALIVRLVSDVMGDG